MKQMEKILSAFLKKERKDDLLPNDGEPEIHSNYNDDQVFLEDVSGAVYIVVDESQKVHTKKVGKDTYHIYQVIL